MAGEHIEDLNIPLLKMKNSDVQAKHNFLYKPKVNMTDNELEQQFSKSMDADVAHEVIQNP
jgi:hypothetical protein